MNQIIENIGSDEENMGMSQIIENSELDGKILFMIPTIHHEWLHYDYPDTDGFYFVKTRLTDNTVCFMDKLSFTSIKNIF